MGDIITEALLEMHFHHALVNYFSNLYGARFLKLLKPSQQQEAWVGFDQGWVNSSLSSGEFLEELRDAIPNRKNDLDKFYLGYFLQFKQVEQFSKRSKYTPSHYTVPYLRVELSLYPNSTTGLSQHETLTILQNIRNTSVFYACAMMFNLDEIYETPDLAKLRMVPITSAPTGWTPMSKYSNLPRHFIFFQTAHDTPLWCSEPVEGKAYSFEQWASGQITNSPKPLNGEQLHNLIAETVETIPPKTYLLYLKRGDKRFMRILPESMVIIEFKKGR